MVDSARILIIDDDPIIRMLAGSALSDVGHLVTEAESAEAAIDLLTELRPALHAEGIRLLQRDGRMAKLKVDAVDGRVLKIKRKERKE